MEIEKIPVAAILNAHPNYAEQISAGGIPYIIEDGEYKIALIQMKRTHFHSWEIAKGKLELGETPLQAAKERSGKRWGGIYSCLNLIFLERLKFSILAKARLASLEKHSHLFIQGGRKGCRL